MLAISREAPSTGFECLVPSELHTAGEWGMNEWNLVILQTSCWRAMFRASGDKVYLLDASWSLSWPAQGSMMLDVRFLKCAAHAGAKFPVPGIVPRSRLE